MASNVKSRRQSILPGVIALGSAVALLLTFLLFLGLGRPPATDDGTRPRPTLPPNPYGPQDFGYDGDYLTCLAGESVLGIDVSEFQLDIDWHQVRAAGVEFVMIRLGYRGSESGRLNEDSMAQIYYEGARAAGLKIGAYFFSQAINVNEAQAEAAFALDLIRDWELEMPLVYDWEYAGSDARTWDMTGEMLTDCTEAFCALVAQAGYTPMVYFNQHQATHLLDLPMMESYPLWLAMYDQEMTWPDKIQMWQYTCEGSVPGISVPVDLNLWFPDL